MNTFVISLLSVAVVVFVGWLAGKLNIVPPHVDNAFSIFILKFSLPLLLFYSSITTPVSQMLDPKINGAFIVSLIGMFILMFVIHKLIYKRSLQASAESAFVCSYPNTAFLGIPLMLSIVGSSAMVPIVISNIIVGVFIIPATIIMIEIGVMGNDKQVNIRHILLRVLKTPLIILPLCGIALAALGIKLPEVIAHPCQMLGSTTPGISLFTLGLIMSRFKIRFSKLATMNIFSKNLLHPFLMVGIVQLFGLTGIVAKELIVLCALPTAITATIFSVTFEVEPEINVSSTILGTILSMVTVFGFLWWLKL